MRDHDNDREEVLRRIRAEAQAQTGALDLRGLSLEGLPDELFKLTWLRELRLGRRLGASWFGQRFRIEDDAAKLAQLTALRFLAVARTNLVALDFLKQMPQLQRLDCSDTGVANLSALSGLPQLQQLYCRKTKVDDLRALCGLTQLQHLDCSDTGVANLSALSGLTQLQHLDCSRTKVDNLSALRGLTQLQQLHCSYTKVDDLGPLSGLTQLQHLDCSYTDVTDLSALRGLTQLQQLHCSGTKVDDLGPLSGLTQLQQLHCSGTKVDDLGPLSGLTQLQQLLCGGTKVDDLSALSGLTQLQQLHCGRTKVDDLSALSGLTQLQHLDCSETDVSDLSALSGLTQLQHLDCSETDVSDLSALSGLTQLQELNCSNTRVDYLRVLLQLPTLEALYAADVAIAGIPARGVLSTEDHDNCLPRLRAHYADLAAGAVQDSRVKLLILGNGGAGKTQIAGSLCRADFTLNPAWDSTHGIQVEMADLPDGLKLSVWDFGGQDIYHGAHALFLNSPALMLLVWAADTEARSGVREGAEWFRDYPLPYWGALARQQGHAASAITLVQNKCDQPADEVRPFPVPAAALEGLAFPAASLHISVLKRRGLAGLRERLGEAAQWLRDPAQMGVPLIGAGRDRLRQRLEGMQAENKQVPAAQRRRLLSMEEFRALCAEAGGITAPEHVLTWLDAEGVVLYRPGLFNNQVVLDQGWALEAIYAIFDRKSQALTAIRRQDGRFDRDLLGRLVWQGFGGDEQELFLSMMQSCGICFVHRRWWEAGEWYEEFIAPDLLPGRNAMEEKLEARWDGEAATAEWRMEYPLLHSGLIRTILCMIGEVAGPDAVYWQGGVCGFETNYKSRFWIEQVIPAGGWAGHILLRTQRGDAEGLLARLGELVEQAQAKVGLRGNAGPSVPRQREGTRMGEVALQPGPEPVTGETWYVSYAWADEDTPKREQDVDRLCKAAKAQGRTILRDKNVLRPGDSISDFMRRLGKGDRVFVMLSDKYLKSPNCMFELFMLWQNCQRDGDFKDRVELWVLNGFKIGQVEDWMDRAEYWLERVEKLNARVQNRGATVLGEAGQRQLILMEQFSRHVVDILAHFADRVRETTWDKWLKHVLN